VPKPKKSLGRDPFKEPVEKEPSRALKKLITGKALKAESDTKEVEVRVKLTASNIKHLDTLRRQLSSGGKGSFSRSRLIRIAIALLSLEDI